MRFKIVVEKIRGKMGMSDFETQTIYLHPNQGLDVVRMTLLHEIMHCIFFQIPHGLSSDEEERAIRTLEPFLLQSLRDTELSSFLLGEP